MTCWTVRGLVGAVCGVVLTTMAACPAAAPLQMTVGPTTINPTVGMVKLDPGSKVIEIPGRIEFRTAKAVLRTSSHALLDQVVDILKANPQIVKLEIQGHTDIKGKVERNKVLSQQRAESVREYLIGKGIDGGRLEPKGYGSERPIDSNETAAGRAKNRRVEFHIVGDKAVNESAAGGEG